MERMILLKFYKNFSNGPENVRVCLLGPQLLKQPPDGVCNRTYYDESSELYRPSWLYKQFCKNVSDDGAFSKLVKQNDDSYLDGCHSFFRSLTLTSRMKA